MSLATDQRSTVRGARSFRGRLLVAMMVVVSAITAAILAINEHNADASSHREIEAQFQGQLGELLVAQEKRQAPARESCQRLVRSVRIRAALAEDDTELLYTAADTVVQSMAMKPEFFCFLDDAGAVLPPPSGTIAEAVEPWREQIGAAGIVGQAQQTGYLAARREDGPAVLREIIATPILAAGTQEKRGMLALGFPPVDLSARPERTEIPGGIWLAGRLEMSTLPPAAREPVRTALAEKLRDPRSAGNSLRLTIEDSPYLLFYQLLNPNSRLAPAWRVGLYPLAGALALQRQQRWKIIGSGFAVLLAGLAATYVLSVRLARPVEQLAEDSVGHQEGREQAEAALVLTEQKYRSIFENAVEGIFLLSREGLYLSANPALARIYGYESPGQFIAEQPVAVERYARPELAAEFVRRVESEEVVADFEAEMLCRDGRRIWVSQNARAIRDPSGGLLHFEGTLEEITGRKNAADALVAVNLQLEKALADLQSTQQHVIQQERLRALGQMASGIAHDFNNALMPITGFSELLLLRPEILADKAKATHYLSIINTGAQDAASIVGRLREFYRSTDQHDVLVAVDAHKLADQAVALTRPKWKDQAQAGGAEITICTELADFPPVAGEESALREVLTNLIFNAVDAMPSGGTLTLRTRAEAAHGVIEISDSGTGMTPEVRARCLEPFFSTKGERGTGLGLAMVFGIIQRHRGEIDIESAIGRGTTFIIRLPYYSAGDVAAQTPALAAATPPLRILLVDDEPQIRDVLSAFLAMDGHTVETAPHGVAGLALFHANRFDLVITDKAMPGMSGDQMAVTMKGFAPTMPIILLTGFSPFLDGSAIPGIDVLATKPITLPGLRDAVEHAMKAA